MNCWKVGFGVLNGVLTVGLLAGTLALTVDNIEKNREIDKLKLQLMYGNGLKPFPIYHD